jgi:hypothetical protein
MLERIEIILLCLLTKEKLKKENPFKIDFTLRRLYATKRFIM